MQTMYILIFRDLLVLTAMGGIGILPALVGTGEPFPKKEPIQREDWNIVAV